MPPGRGGQRYSDVEEIKCARCLERARSLDDSGQHPACFTCMGNAESVCPFCDLEERAEKHTDTDVRALVEKLKAVGGHFCEACRVQPAYQVVTTICQRFSSWQY